MIPDCSRAPSAAVEPSAVADPRTKTAPGSMGFLTAQSTAVKEAEALREKRQDPRGWRTRAQPGPRNGQGVSVGESARGFVCQYGVRGTEGRNRFGGRQCAADQGAAGTGVERFNTPN